MTKYVTLYQPNENGEVEKIETINGEVVNEGHEGYESFASRAWAWFFSTNHDQTVGGNKWEKSQRATDGNGREWSSSVGNNMDSTAEVNGSADPKWSYEAPQDYQGSVPCWDGYNGE